MSDLDGMGRGVTVGSLFAAIGGFCRAFQEVGASVLWATDKDRAAAETFRLNFPSVPYLNKLAQRTDARTLQSAIAEHVDRGTQIYTDEHFAYRGLETMSYRHGKALVAGMTGKHITHRRLAA